MDLELEFADGTLSGAGNDDVGPFTIRGGYNAASLECYWTKTYPGSHDVYYRGFREGKGIWGAWEIDPLSHGGFHIWPRALGEGEGEVAHGEEPLAAKEDRAEKQPVSIREACGTTRSFHVDGPSLRIVATPAL
jgi:hypothetical protein